MIFFVGAAISFAITSMPMSNELAPATLTPSTRRPSNPFTTTAPGTQTALLLPPVITIAPLVANPLEKRQKCWDDRGFSVNCATWTGYYYTWGPAGNPYEGGPGEGGGSGSGGESVGSTVVVYQNDTGRLDLTSWSALLGMFLLGVVLLL